MRKIVPLFAALMLTGMLALAQTHTVTGRVTDEKGEPLPFATINEIGTRNATTADANGNYTISVHKNARLTVSATGHQSQTMAAQGGNVNFSLTTGQGQMQEVVVTALGIRRQAKEIGYSTQTVSNKELNVSKPVNVAQGLVGRVAGAQISTINNGVNPDVRIQLRGERHINADNQALIVVDGMIVRADFLSSINPEDIDNVSILKGATAAALYGSEATNGVMIVTTRRGADSKGKPSISFSTTNTFERLSYMPKLQTQFSGYGGETGNFFYGPAVDPYTGFATYAPFENQQYGPEFNGDTTYGYIGGPNEQGKVFKTPFVGINPDTRKNFFQTGFTTQNDLSYSSGDRDNSFFIGLQDVSIKGTLPKDQSRRTSARFGGRKTYGIFSADFNLSYVYKTANTAGEDPNGNFPVYWTVLNTPANIPLQSLKNWQDPTSFGNLSNYYNAYYENPYWILDNARHIQNSDNIQGGLTLNLKPTDWFNATYRVGAQVTNTRYKDYRNPAIFSPYAASDPWGASNTASSGNVAGSVNDGDYYYKRLQQDVFLTFNKKFGDLSSTLILGNTIWDRYSSYQYAQSNSTYLTGLYNINYRQGEATVDQGQNDTRLIGGYADLTLAYKAFALHGNFRRDWSSLLAKGNNAYNVYAVDGAFILSDYFQAIKNSNVLSFAKIRAAYSKTGQITVDPYSITNSYDVAAGFPYGSLASLSINNTYNNPALTPEKTVEKEAGIELGFFKNRFNVEATYYHDNNTAQTFPVNISTSTGYARATVNAGETVTSGFEFSAKVSPLVNTRSGLRWDVGANLSIMNSKVVSLLNGVEQFSIGNNNYAIVGLPFPYMQLTDLQRDSATGSVVVDAKTGLPLLNSKVSPVGRTTPKYILGLTTSLSYKGFTLNVIGDYRGGYVFYANVGQNLDFTGASMSSTANGRQSFVYPNSVYKDGSGKYVPNTNVYVADGALGFWVSSNYRKAGTDYLMNAAAWKLRTVSLGYDFGKFISRNAKFVKGATLNVIGNDLLMFRPSQNTWTDPEFNNNNSNGLGYTTYYQLPPTRRLSIQLTVNF